MTCFNHNGYYFRLSTPEYEVPLFCFNVGELRLYENNVISEELLPFSKFKDYLQQQEIKICTYRGKENINVIRILEDVGFKFISTYHKVICCKKEFTEINTNNRFKIFLANEVNYDQILNIERKVLDYSTFSIDPLLDKKIVSERNAIRVKSHFSKPNQRIYVVMINKNIVGFIQFDVDVKNKKADILNLGIHPDFQKMNIGKFLFSNTIKRLFEEGCEEITSDYSTQNIGSAKLHRKANFRIFEQEIHLRYFSK